MAKYILLVILVFSSFAYSEDETNTEAAETTTTTTTTQTTQSTTEITSIADYFRAGMRFIDGGIYDVIGNVLKYFISAFALISLQLKMAALEVGIEIAENLISYLDISGQINSLLGNIDSKIAAFVSYLKIPEAISMLLSAHVTRFVMALT